MPGRRPDGPLYPTEVEMTLPPESIDDLRQAVGSTLGPSDWVELDQARIDAFAEVTGDHQWIHVDPERAAVSEFHGTIAHGYLTLSLTPMLLDQLNLSLIHI